MSLISENLCRVQEAVSRACRRAGRPREEVALMAVSKTHPVAVLEEAAAAGHRLFGENRVQEFAEKSAALTANGYPVLLSHTQAPEALHVHLIGHLQSNKAARAAQLFSSIDTLDSFKLAERLNHAAGENARVLPVLIEIKLSDEPAKEGLLPHSAELADLLERLPGLTHLAPRGLMTVAPIDGDPAVARSCFRALRFLHDQLAQQYPRLDLSTLSMGMSGDYEAAIEEGSTEVRIGTAIFGSRPRRA